MELKLIQEGLSSNNMRMSKLWFFICFCAVVMVFPFTITAQTKKEWQQMQLLAYQRDVLGGARQQRLPEADMVVKEAPAQKRMQYFIYFITPVAIADTQYKKLEIGGIAYAFKVEPVNNLPVTLVQTEMPGTAPDTLVKQTACFVYQLIPAMNQMISNNNNTSTSDVRVILALHKNKLYHKTAAIKILPPLALQ